MRGYTWQNNSTTKFSSRKITRNPTKATGVTGNMEIMSMGDTIMVAMKDITTTMRTCCGIFGCGFSFLLR